jgi:hypothetical protein
MTRSARTDPARAPCSLAPVSLAASADRSDAAGLRARDELRTARLLFDAELADGSLAPAALDAWAVRRAARARPVPRPRLRLAQDVARKLGRLDWERSVARPLGQARRAVLGEAAAAPPRFLVRVDEFPHYQAWDERERFGGERFARFHALMRAAGVPYLIAVTPRLSRAPLSPAETRSRPLEGEELRQLAELAADGEVAIALHGRDHRTRFANPRRHSELCGLAPEEAAALLDDALAQLAARGVAPEIFVPPYNRFDAAHLALLAERFAVVCGGPESIGTIGFRRSPVWFHDAVHLPGYAPLYGHAREVLPAAERAIAAQDGLWTPIVLHWGWESDAGWDELERLLERIAPHAARWDDFLAAVARSGEGVA